MKNLLRRFRRALTIEYAIVMMTLVAAFVALILTTASVTGEKASGYRKYTERKSFLDEVARTYIESYCGGEGDVRLEELYKDNDYNFSFTYSQDELYVRQGSEHATIELYVALADVDGDGVREPVRYVYGLG